MQRVIHLALYGSIGHGVEFDLNWDLYQTEPLARLRDISLSSVPSRFVPHGMAAARFQHSVGVSYLARQLCELRRPLRPWRKELACAALCHDIGSPPFSHISELFFYELTGRTHEQQTELLLAPGTELHMVMDAYGVDAAQVIDIINGRHDPLGPLMAGSIDLDNADNSLHLLHSLGYGEQLPYHPLRLINAFHLRRGQVMLDSDYLAEVLGWAEARERLYGLLHSEPNLSSTTMLYRALEFAFADGTLSGGFFELGESDALGHLQRNCAEETVLLIEQLMRWRQYPLAYAQTNATEDPRLVGLYDNWQARKVLADRLADELGLAPYELALYVGRDRGEKSITLPWFGEQAEPAAALFSNRCGHQRLAVFTSKRCRELHSADGTGMIPAVTDAVKRALADLPPAGAGTRHVFF